MTENQRQAQEYLGQYRGLMRKLSYLADRIKEQELKATSVRSSMGFETGIDKSGRAHLLEHSKTFDPGARERLLHVLLNQAVEYDQERERAEVMAREIEQDIDRLLTDERYRLVLKYIYVKQCTYTQTAYKMNYSYWHIKRLHWTALEAFGRKMTQDDPA